MRWIVGVDLREQCQGALRFCRWVEGYGTPASDDRFEAIHVLEDRDLRSLQTHVSLSEVERMARESFASVMDRAGPSAQMSTELVCESTAEGALSRRVADDPHALLVIGRLAPLASQSWQRLGRVARRLLRSLPAPTIVVPPDFSPPDGSAGPIVVATDLKDDSDGAARFAVWLGQRWQCPVVVTHVLANALPGYVPPVAQQRQVEASLEAGERNLEIWQHRNGLAGAEGIVSAGDVVGRVMAVAREREASMIVVGSRRLSLGARIFHSSVGSDIAGAAPMPVAVVPPPAK